jgi:hypothetical protein
MTKAHIMAGVVALSLAGSTPSFAVTQMSKTNNGVKWHPHAVHGSSMQSGSNDLPIWPRFA